MAVSTKRNRTIAMDVKTVLVIGDEMSRRRGFLEFCLRYFFLRTVRYTRAVKSDILRFTSYDKYYLIARWRNVHSASIKTVLDRIKFKSGLIIIHPRIYSSRPRYGTNNNYYETRCRLYNTVHRLTYFTEIIYFES